MKDIVLYDNFNRPQNYLRLAVTDRCNLRCTYCMPSERMTFLPKDDLLSYEELERVISIFTHLGINKIRLTGGEPFVRKDIMQLLQFIANNEDIKTWAITSNAVLIEPYLAKLKAMNINSLNISLDSVHAEKFEEITKRNELNTVLKAIERSLSLGIRLKLNCVALPSFTKNDIISFVEFFKNEPLDIRFIEYMPFNERNEHHNFLSHTEIMAIVEDHFGQILPTEFEENATASLFHLNNMKARVGTIAAYSRSFCGSCNRIRLSATGDLKTCLYANSALNIKELIRLGKNDEEISSAIQFQLTNRHKDGFVAEAAAKSSPFVSMSKIGG